MNIIKELCAKNNMSPSLMNDHYEIHQKIYSRKSAKVWQ